MDDAGPRAGHSANRFQSAQEVAQALTSPFAPPEARARWGASFEAPDDVLEVSALDDAPDDERTTRVRDAGGDRGGGRARPRTRCGEHEAEHGGSRPRHPVPRGKGRGWGPGALGGALLAAAALVGRWASVHAPMTPRAVSSAAVGGHAPRRAAPACGDASPRRGAPRGAGRARARCRARRRAAASAAGPGARRGAAVGGGRRARGLHAVHGHRGCAPRLGARRERGGRAVALVAALYVRARPGHR